MVTIHTGSSRNLAMSLRTMIYDTSNKRFWTPARFSGFILRDKAALTLLGAWPKDKDEYHCWLHILVLDTVRDQDGKPGHKPLLD